MDRTSAKDREERPAAMAPRADRRRSAGFRGTLGEAGQSAIVLVVAMSVLLMTIGGILVSQTIATDPLVQADSVQHYAYRALQSGMNAYQSTINTNPNLANCNTSTNGTAICQDAQYQTWNLVSGTDAGNGVVPEWYLFDNPQPIFNANGSLASLQVQIVGAAGFPNHYSYQSSIANLQSVNGYLDVVWWSDYEANDSKLTNPNYITHKLCKYDYNNGYNGPGPNCTPVYFGPNDTINGPVYSNDSIYVTGGPNFGTASNPGSVTTADPNCLFVGPPGTECSTDVGTYAPPPVSSTGHSIETSTSDVSALALVAREAAPNNGCVYYGPTTIALSGSTMTVTSPDTTIPSAGCPASGATGNLPPNGVLYVSNAVASGNPNSKVVKYANPFDDHAHSGKYAQTCGNYTNNGYTMPCYFGWTGPGGQDSEADAFVSGQLATTGSVAGDLTIATDNDIIVDGNLTYSDCSGKWTGTANESACQYRTDGRNDVLGLIATNYVNLDHPIDPARKNTLLPVCGSAQANKDPVTGKTVSPAFTAPLCQPLDSGRNITIDAAILTLTQSFWVDNFASGSTEGQIILYGSLQQEARGTVGIIGQSGFTKYYTWDPRLELVAPPSYINPGTASYQLNSSAILPAVTCPPLKDVYGTAGTTACPALPSA